MTKQMFVRREKHLLYFRRSNSTEEIRYDLNLKSMQKFKKGEWHNISRDYKYFRYYSPNNIIIDEKEVHFLELLNKVVSLNPNCESLSTFISRFNEAIIYENYIQEGIKTECHCSNEGRYGYRKRILTKPIEFYERNIINFFKRYDIEITVGIERKFSDNYPLMKTICNAIEFSKIPEDRKAEKFRLLIGYRHDEFKDLIQVYNYEPKSLLNYLINYLERFENCEMSEGIFLLRDYIKMATQIGRDVKKYPKYLKSMHDIINSNYNAYKQDYNELLFEKVSKPHLEFEGKKYTIVIPKTSKDIIAEGTSLSHCVSSYVDRVINQETYIFFLRLTEAKDRSLITLELHENKIVQAKGSYNRPVIKEEYDFLEKYSKEKELILQIPKIINGGENNEDNQENN
jgi:hypothetical protein